MPGRSAAKGDFKIGLARDRAHAAGDRALERLGRRFLGDGLGLMLEDILALRHLPVYGERAGEGHLRVATAKLPHPARFARRPLPAAGEVKTQLSATFTELSGSSTPKQR